MNITEISTNQKSNYVIICIKAKVTFCGVKWAVEQIIVYTPLL